MTPFIKQAKHNKKFYDCISENFKDQFYDWKVTVLYYISIHYLKALASKRGVDIGDTHREIDLNVNPDRDHVKMRITRNAYREYKKLLIYSRIARYDGITDFVTFEKIQKRNHIDCLIHLEAFKKYIVGQGVILEE